MSVLEEKAVKDYITFRGDDAFLRHRRHYALAKALTLFLKHSGSPSVEEALKNYVGNVKNLHMVLQGVVNELSENNAPKTVWFYIGLIKDFLGFHDVNVDAAFRKLRLPKNAATRVDRIPSLSELQRLILSSKSPRLRLLIQLLAQTGLRLNEALHLRVKNIDFERGVIRLSASTTKTGDAREIPLCDELAEAIKNYLRQRKKESEWLFPSESDPSKPTTKNKVYDAYHALLKRLGLDSRDPSNIGYELHLHTLRKWFKTRLESASVNRLLIEKWMGHNIGVQGVYFLPTGEDLEKEIKKANEALRIFGVKHDEQASQLEDFKQIVTENNRLIIESLILTDPKKAYLFLRGRPDLLRQYLENLTHHIRLKQIDLTREVNRILSSYDEFTKFAKGIILRNEV